MRISDRWSTEQNDFRKYVWEFSKASQALEDRKVRDVYERQIRDAESKTGSVLPTEMPVRKGCHLSCTRSVISRAASAVRFVNSS